MSLWIDNGLVKPGEEVRIAVSERSSNENKPETLTIYPLYLETGRAIRETVALEWRAKSDAQAEAVVVYTPTRPGNYYAEVVTEDGPRSAYFSVWEPGMTIVSFWSAFADSFHSRGNHKDLYMKEAKAYKLPLDFELMLVGDNTFISTWYLHRKLRTAQQEVAADVVPFFDGAYFHRVHPDFQDRFNYDEEGRVPDPTFHGLTAERCGKLIEGARSYWKKWGYREFTGISTYSPSNSLMLACRQAGVRWVSGLFPEYDFTDGRALWQSAWVQRHAGMPEFPYYPGTDDFRKAGTRGEDALMIFPADRRNPVLNHAGFYAHGTDTLNCIRHYGDGAADKLMEYAEVFIRNNRLTRGESPFAISYTLQMDDLEMDGQVEVNREMLSRFAQRARAGDVIFAHKRHLQQYYARHEPATPEIACCVGDLLADAPRDTVKKFHFSRGHEDSAGTGGEASQGQYDLFGPDYVKEDPFPEVVWWEGAEGKAAFVERVPDGVKVDYDGSPQLPFWWYDYRRPYAYGDRDQPERVKLAGVSCRVEMEESGERWLVIDSPAAFSELPVCLWGHSRPDDVTGAGTGTFAGHPAKIARSPYTEAAYTLVRVDVAPGSNRIKLD
ncbi:hypothetical protein [Cohnella cellulosilytica]|uniref:Uncharacterized protein n=1 Tax=Cohnella cellulosilytica TaxID=986710 RepID=A0ABW2FIN0_9BACL